MDCSPPGSSVHGILQARILEWIAMPSSRGSSQPRDRTQVSGIEGGFLSVWATREAKQPLEVGYLSSPTESIKVKWCTWGCILCWQENGGLNPGSLAPVSWAWNFLALDQRLTVLCRSTAGAVVCLAGEEGWSQAGSWKCKFRAWVWGPVWDNL